MKTRSKYTRYRSKLEHIISIVVIVVLIVLMSNVTIAANKVSNNDIYVTQKKAFPESKNAEARQKKWVVATAYSLDPAQTDDTPCIPANGEDLCAMRREQGTHNTIAANFLRLGTQVKIPELFGEKILVTRDRMNPRYNGTNRIDVLVDTRQEAILFGVKYVSLEIY